MKLTHLFLITLISIGLSTIACKDSQGDTTSEETTTGTTDGSIVSDPIVMDPTIPPVTTGTTGSTGASGESHYKCNTAGCKGGGDAAGKCPVCGAELVHNQAFHAQATAPGASPANAVKIDPTTGTPPANATPAPPTAQNAKGEYHYKCAKGHAGAASAGNCGTCGEALVHNQAYHNN